MPIRPELRHHYRTPAWFAARKACRERAGDRCERCGAKNGAVGFRREGKITLVEMTEKDAKAALLTAPWLNMVRIQCGCCHRNNVAGDDRPENLAWWCRGCHLRHDKPHHRETRAARKDAARPLLAIEGAA